MAQGRYNRVSCAPVHVGALIRETCRELDMHPKEAAILAEIDPATFSRALIGEAPLDLWHLALLPMRWWRLFLMKFTAALIVSWFDASVEAAARDARRRTAKECLACVTR